MKIKLSDIRVMNYVRKTTEIEELAEDIKKNGLINPIIIRRWSKQYILLDGYRRLLALKKLGYDEIEAIVQEF